MIKKPPTRGGYSPARGLQNTNPQWVVAPVEKQKPYTHVLQNIMQLYLLEIHLITNHSFSYSHLRRDIPVRCVFATKLLYHSRSRVAEISRN